MQYVTATTSNTIACVFRETVPLLSLRLPSEETQSWQTVSEKPKRHAAPNSSTQTSSGMFFLIKNALEWCQLTHSHCSHWILYAEWESRGSRRSNKMPSQSAPGARVHKQHSWPPQATPDDTRNKFRRSDQRSSPVAVFPEEEEESAILELLHKDEHNFPSLGTSPQTVKPLQKQKVHKNFTFGSKDTNAFFFFWIQATPTEVIKKGGEKRGSRKKDQKEQVSETGEWRSSVPFISRFSMIGSRNSGLMTDVNCLDVFAYFQIQPFSTKEKSL